MREGRSALHSLIRPVAAAGSDVVNDGAAPPGRRRYWLSGVTVYSHLGTPEAAQAGPGDERIATVGPGDERIATFGRARDLGGRGGVVLKGTTVTAGVQEGVTAGETGAVEEDCY